MKVKNGYAVLISLLDEGIQHVQVLPLADVLSDHLLVEPRVFLPTQGGQTPVGQSDATTKSRSMLMESQNVR